MSAKGEPSATHLGPRALGVLCWGGGFIGGGFYLGWPVLPGVIQDKNLVCGWVCSLAV